MNPNLRARVLLVDDNEANLLALHAVLDSPEFELVEARSGMEAVRLMEEDNFAAILLDIQMPDLDGYETAQRIRKIPGATNVPIIFLTAFYKEDEDVQRGYAAGAVDYFAKPFNTDVLKAKVKIYAERHLKTAELREKERKLAAAERKRLEFSTELDALIETVHEGVIITSVGGTIIRMNDEARGLWFGAGPAPARWNWSDPAWWADPRELERLRSVLPGLLERGGTLRNETAEIRCSDGNVRTVVISISPLKLEAGAVVGTVWALLDVESAIRLAHARSPKSS